jgi:hypothetical protein
VSGTEAKNPLVEIASVSEGDDGRLEVLVRVGSSHSRKLMALGDRRRGETLRKCFAAGLRQSVSSHRITARIPLRAMEELDRLCAEVRSSRSQLMLARVDRYVDHDGSISRSKYKPPGRAWLTNDDWDNLQQLQVVGSREQVKGFKKFCRQASINRDQFFVREIKLLADRAQRPGFVINRLLVQCADAADVSGGPTPDPPAEPNNDRDLIS